MRSVRLYMTLAWLFCAWWALVPGRAMADDIDIFITDSSLASTYDNPNVLIVLDNTSNWARNDQGWTDKDPITGLSIKQGQAELKAIKDVIGTLNSSINVGLMLFTDTGSGREGGYIRFPVLPMNDTNKLALQTLVDTIYTNFSSPTEKTSASANYSAVMFDAFKYFGGYTSPANVASGTAGSPVDATHFGPDVFNTRTDSTLSDVRGYTSASRTTYAGPITSTNSCSKNFVIFIGNGFPNADIGSPANMDTYLSGISGDTSQLAISGFNTTTTTVSPNPTIVNTAYPNATYPTASGSACWTDVTACTNSMQTTASTSYACASPPSPITSLTACPIGSSRYVVQAKKGSTTSILGTTFCLSTPPTGTPPDFVCPTGGWNCTYGSALSNIAPISCPAGTSSFSDLIVTKVLVTSNNTYAVPPTNKQRMTDEWARYMYQTDANGVTAQQNISTYTIDVFHDKQDADQTGLLMNMARAGGGKYTSATSKDEIVTRLKQIMSEIQAVNTVFASASLPVNATNRAQNENQVFIGMFRPSRDPSWFGNVKRYQLANFAGFIDLADLYGNRAVNLQTGFVSECATSWWTSDSTAIPAASPVKGYWDFSGTPSKQTLCATLNNFTLASTQGWSDLPDGPQVEKGAVAEVIRKGNNPPTTDSTPTWAPNRNLKTVPSSPGALLDFTFANSGLSDTSLYDFISGKDVNNENGNIYTTTETRASLHGDVVHSRPLPVNYGTIANPTAGVTVFYGANDGWLRAVNANTGKERWALTAPEFNSKFQRLKDSGTSGVSISVEYFGTTDTTAQEKDYFWDGSVGLYQNIDNSKVWIFPTMRRGGRMLYALDVSSVDSPRLLWKAGCPNLANDTGCANSDGSAGMTEIGETWSLPSVAFIKGYESGTEPVVVVGGGYDACEDANVASPSCSSAKGRVIYVLKASTGEIIRKFDLASAFSTSHSVASDVSFVDVNNDGLVDYAYVADTGGNFYRIDFVDGASGYAALDSSAWNVYRVAYTTGTGSPVTPSTRKFLFPPAVLYTGGSVYVAAGSGDREHPLAGERAYSDILNRFYVFLDKLSVKPTTPTDLDPAKRPLDLDDPVLMNNVTSTNSCTASQVLTTSSIKGWYMDLNQYGQGEQTVTSALILGGLITFSTNRPVPPASGSCSTTLGEARGYWVNLLNGSGGIGVGTSTTCGGTRSSTFVGGGLPPSPVTGVVPVDGVSRTVIIGAVQRDSTASAPISGQRVVPSINPVRKRLYWFKSID